MAKTSNAELVAEIEALRQSLQTERRERQRLQAELEQRDTSLTEALEQQAATSEILRVISCSLTDIQPVLDAIAESAARLCESLDAVILRRDGDRLVLVAHYGSVPFGPIGEYSFPLVRGTVAGRTVLDGRTVHVADLQSEADEFPQGSEFARRRGFRTALCVPLMREGVAIGTIDARRTEARLFTERQVALLQTFADQAVIAIENVRLFKELEARNRDLTEALEQQTATAEILRVISSSPTDVQPVFDTIVASAGHLCGAESAVVYRFQDEMVDAVALYNLNPDPDAIEAYHRRFPRRLGDTDYLSRVADGSVLNIGDIAEHPHTATTLAVKEPRFVAGMRMTDEETISRSRNIRSFVLVPMVREGQAIGAIGVSHHDVGAFSDERVHLLRTFAAQAVIAIENVRLFKELEARNRELTEALDRQTATSEILRVIASSPTDIQPVLDGVVQSAVRLCGAADVQLLLVRGDVLELAAAHGSYETARTRPIRRSLVAGRAVVDQRPVHVPDIELERDEFPESVALGRPPGVRPRTLLAIPLLREETCIGVIQAVRTAVRPFSDKQIELLQTFAAQAVIAIENVRLFKELEARTQDLTRSVGELQALGEVGQAISSTLDLRTVLSTIVARATQLSGTDAGVIYEYDEQREIFLPRATEHLEAEIVETMLATPVRKGEGATGRLAEVQEPLQLPDILEAPAESRVRGALVRAGYRALLAVPLVREDHLLGGLTVIRKTPGDFPAEVVELLKNFATQSALAIQNARLFREIEQKSRELEAASRHKSEFLSNMSHELRTPLNAIIGFSEVLGDRLFGELTDKQEEYLKDIMESGQHLLSLINDILDLSKIEAGRMELELTEFDLPQALDNALTLVRERAGRRGIALHQTVDERLGEVRGDERKVKQVLLNLLSNALKFTPEGGRVDVSATVVDAMVEVSVTDTGVGIAPEDQEALFEEFRQVGTAAKKVEGTGLGLALSRKFVELHGGRIWVKSHVGVGSTFTFTLPLAVATADAEQ